MTMKQLPVSHTPPSLSNLFVYPAVVIFVLPVVCGALIIVSTFMQAQNDVQTWRAEFDMALQQLCSAEDIQDINVSGGDGRVYLDAYQLDYQWIDAELSCTSNGRTINCSCNESEVSISVSKYQQNEER